jgi:hypothetical protein
MTTNTEAPVADPSWNADDGEREVTARRIALMAGQDVAKDTATWWSAAAATLADLREKAPRHLPATPDDWEEWFDSSKIRTHADTDQVLAYMDMLVAACDSIAADYTREQRRLVRETRAADDAVEAGRSGAPDAGTIGG